jgi:hypothetical protein
VVRRHRLDRGRHVSRDGEATCRWEGGGGEEPPEEDERRKPQVKEAGLKKDVRVLMVMTACRKEAIARSPMVPAGAKGEMVLHAVYLICKKCSKTSKHSL